MLKLDLDLKRMRERKCLSGLLPGKMLIERTGHYISGRAVDVSENGIGIITSSRLKQGDRILLSIAKKTIEFTVLHMKRDFQKNSQWRVGLVLVEEKQDQKKEKKPVNLIDMLQGSGFFASDSSSQSKQNRH
ncbi:MAG: PilZ domain-containing protein [Proteobacteria bacterium]|nr:PilZ domain-containing protein [Pseudomonadota bacterium]